MGVTRVYVLIVELAVMLAEREGVTAQG